MAKNAEKPSNGAKSGRDSKGRFTVGIKGGGRKEKPEELKDIHKKTIPEIWELAQHSANEKVRLDALKFLTEMDIGKARQSVDANIDDGKLDVTIEVV